MQPILTGQGIEITDPIKKRISELFAKHAPLLADSTKIDGIVKKISIHEGKEKTIGFEVIVHLPNSIIRIEERGEDLYSIVDQIDPKLRRQLVQYSERKNDWEKSNSWKEDEVNKLIESQEDETIEVTGADLSSLVVKRKEYSDNTPISVSAAIEKMEDIGRQSFLFRNSDGGKYTMIYKREDGSYGLIEPKYTAEE